MATTEQIPISPTSGTCAPVVGAERADFTGAIRSLVITAVIGAIVYRHVLTKLVLDWWQDPNYSHGFVMPVFAAFAVWKMRDQLLKVESRPSWWGLVLGIAAMGILVVGVLGAELFLSRFSLLVLGAATVLLFLGWN